MHASHCETCYKAISQKALLLNYLFIITVMFSSSVLSMHGTNQKQQIHLFITLTFFVLTFTAYFNLGLPVCGGKTSINKHIDSSNVNFYCK